MEQRRVCVGVAVWVWKGGWVGQMFSVYTDFITLWDAGLTRCLNSLHKHVCVCVCVNNSHYLSTISFWYLLHFSIHSAPHFLSLAREWPHNGGLAWQAGWGLPVLSLPSLRQNLTFHLRRCPAIIMSMDFSSLHQLWQEDGPCAASLFLKH